MTKNKIDEEIVKNLVSKALNAGNSSYITGFILTNNFKTKEINKIVKIIIRNFSDDEIYKLYQLLLNDPSNISKDLICDLIWVCYDRHKKDVLDLLLILANDNDWGVRESAAWPLAFLLYKHYNEILPFIKKMTNHSSPYIRRTAAVAIMRYAKRRISGKGIELLKLLEPLLYNRHPYVRRNLGPFIIGDGFIRYYPKDTIKWLKKWMKNDDEQVRWNVAKVFSTAEGANLFDIAIEILDYLAKDPRKYVRRAVISSLKNLIKRKPNLTLDVLKRWKNDNDKKEIVEQMLSYYEKKFKEKVKL